ncbi:hypothetical protein A3H89_03915 [Candidatus Amesbacteria bacterium RIFCSPLOWO2_02_FULL_48_11]|uniref:Uncharacterized protein n=1 Tax=Candidatus Amesbacteria bacterium GW2011_GWC1_48_10 TaxID=1618365 RepID=A0A0G1UKI2_9BACT|nr:MAG: hypothetical protein UY22_C0010G0020 [Candidatus Amesbacteria bacterium GW2011_GWC1_48_10]OGC91424.1 MAG: hypothetical protein A2V48_03935 [Candidatus Amesbacteria bacterium RBG_19FT_COMBO_48_16]OGC95235.1 MAG: hypothetical protein A3C34_04655 [Candidatus Amesbacteria bacterium RIFCSPHIGHO2_02_FULL_48_21]OGD02576.1 MAG: hypothetical protein A2354_00695 [Candidatus Amesbacteria bacterium RIFOXYB1_FULL_47_12]OGD08645.1 MAG: hypothetical protein A3H89_03915 [Candidatus Amesbacteria bacteri
MVNLLTRLRRPKSLAFLGLISLSLFSVLYLLSTRSTPPPSLPSHLPGSPSTPPSTLSPADAAKAEQTANDLYFAKTVQKLYAQYPFLRNLPIDTNKYTIVYDYQKQSLRVRLKKVSRKSVEKEINQTLTGIGVDLEKTAIYYLDQ